MRRLPSGGTVHIEDIQDQVKFALMRSEHHKVARAYDLYREEHARLRSETTLQNDKTKTQNVIHITAADGSRSQGVSQLDFYSFQAICRSYGFSSSHYEQNLNLFSGSFHIEKAPTRIKVSAFLQWNIFW